MKSNSNVLTVGQKNVSFYLRLILKLFGNNVHELISLHAFGEQKIYKLTVIMRLLVNWKYCHVVRVKTGTEPAPVLKVSFKKAETFDEAYAAF